MIMRSIKWFFCFFVLSMWLNCGPPPANQPEDELRVLPSERAQSHDQISSEHTRSEPSTHQEAPILRDESPHRPSEPRDESGSFEPSHDASLPEEATSLPEDKPELHPEPPRPEASPESRPESRPDLPPTGTQWIGEACTRDADCNVPNGFCLKESDGFPSGYCTQTCTRTCPDLAGKPVTFCIEKSPNQGYCVSQCTGTSCRTGYTCASRARFNEAATTRTVCIPQSTSTGQSINALFIGDSHACGTTFGKLLVDLLRDPAALCGSAKTQNNKVYSYARVGSAARHWSERSGSSKDWLCASSTIYTNGTSAANTSGAAVCSGITSLQRSVFEELIRKHSPTAFIVELGSNSVGFSESYVKARIQLMLDQMPTGSLCYWVAPTVATSATTVANHRNLERWTRDVLQSYTRIHCHLLTSIDELSQQTTCSPMLAPDGLHLTSCGANLWGKLMVSKICAFREL